MKSKAHFFILIIFFQTTCNERQNKKNDLFAIKNEKIFLCDTSLGNTVINTALIYVPRKPVLFKSLDSSFDSLLREIGIDCFCKHPSYIIATLLIFEKQYLYLLEKKKLNEGGNLYGAPQESGAHILWEAFKNFSKFSTNDSFFISIKIPYDFVEADTGLSKNNYLRDVHSRIKALIK